MDFFSFFNIFFTSINRVDVSLWDLQFALVFVVISDVPHFTTAFR